MTHRMREMTTDELWEELEDHYHAVYKAIENRSYPEHSKSGVRYIQRFVRTDLNAIDYLLLVIESREEHSENEPT